MDPQLEEPDLRSYLAVIARRRWLVILTALLFVGAAIAISLIPEPKYRVRAQVLTTGVNDPVSMIFGANNAGDLDRQATNQVAFLNSSTMRFAVGDAYNGSLPTSKIYDVAISAADSDNENITSSVVNLSLVSSDPEAAATLVNVYANTYVAVRQADDAEKLTNTRAQLQARLTQIDAEIDDIRSELTDIDAQIAAAADQVEVLRLQQTRANLERDLQPQLEPLAAQASDLRARLGNLNTGIELSTGGGAEVLSSAGAPDAPVSPNVPLNIAIGLVFGLFLGSALAFIRDYFDDSVKSKEMVDQVTGVSTLGLIPKIGASSTELVTVGHPSSPAAEAFRSLRTSVKFLGIERQVRVVQVTSPSTGEGKTLVAVNLAVAFAQSGDRVVIVGGDLRRPRMEEILDVPLTPGLTAVLIGDVTLPQAIQTVSSVPNLSVLPSGSPPPNPSELLSGERARRLIDVLGQTYDVVVIDCPPVLPVTDALVVARMADTTLLVTSANKTSKRGLQRAVEMLHQVDAPLSGTVLNSLSSDATFVGEPYRYEQVSHPRPGGGRDDLEPTSPRRRRRQRDRDDEGDPDAEWESLPLPPPTARN